MKEQKWKEGRSWASEQMPYHLHLLCASYISYLKFPCNLVQAPYSRDSDEDACAGALLKEYSQEKPVGV